MSFGSLDVYEGDFIDGRLEGHGVMEYKVRKIMTGMILKDLRVKISQDGTIHEGSWIDWRRHGNGTSTYRNGWSIAVRDNIRRCDEEGL